MFLKICRLIENEIIQITISAIKFFDGVIRFKTYKFKGNIF